MTLTPAQQTLLELPFHLNEHLFNGSNNVYLDKQAIRRRLSLVDPNWSKSPPILVSQDQNTVAFASTLTIGGSSRSGVGVGIINRWNKDKSPMVDFSLALAILKGQKNADADLLPRCAIQFGVGAYLKVEAAKNIKTEAALKEFLAKLPSPPGAHWSANGGRERVAALMKLLNLDWKAVAGLIEPGRTLSGLSDTSLDEAHFSARLAELAYKPAAPKASPAYIQCELQHLSIDDVLEHSTRGVNGGTYHLIEKITAISAMTDGKREVTLQDTATAKSRVILLTNIGLHTLIGGPKLSAAQSDPTLIEKRGPHPVWIGEAVQA